MGAVYYQGLVDRICALYAEGLLVRIPAVVRELAPETLVVHSPSDYVEDHHNAARLAVSPASPAVL